MVHAPRQLGPYGSCLPLRLPGGSLPCLAQSLLGHSLAMGPATVPLALIGGLAEAALRTEGVCSTAADGGFRRLQARPQHREVLLPTQGLAHSLGDLPLPGHLRGDRETQDRPLLLEAAPLGSLLGRHQVSPYPHPLLSLAGTSNGSRAAPWGLIQT